MARETSGLSTRGSIASGGPGASRDGAPHASFFTEKVRLNQDLLAFPKS
jgi:hypothetical protein